MGNRYILTLTCAYCDEKNEDVYYAESCSITTFKCVKCGKTNKIEMNINIIAKKIEK